MGPPCVRVNSAARACPAASSKATAVCKHPTAANRDYFDFESNSRRTLKPKFDANGVDSEGPLFIDFSTRKLRAKSKNTLQVNASKELKTTFNCVGLKTNGGLSLDATTKLLQYNLNPDYFNINVSNQ